MTTNLFSYVENSLRQAEEKREREKRRETAVTKATVSRKGEEGREVEGGGEEEKKLGAPVFVQEDSNEQTCVYVCVQHIREGWSPTASRPLATPRGGDGCCGRTRTGRRGAPRQSPLLRAFQYMGKGLWGCGGWGVLEGKRRHLPTRRKARGEAQRMVWGERRYWFFF